MSSSRERMLLTLRTVRHLRVGQVACRLRYRLRAAPRVRDSPAPPRRALATPCRPLPRARSLAAGPSFTFLGVTRHYPDGVRWLDLEAEKLWRYNLHYFDYLGQDGSWAEDASSGSLVRDWIVSNPPPGGDGWEPYPTSLRIVNWIRWCLSDGGPGDAPDGDGDRTRDVLDSLALQTRWLERNLEHHILANHLFANAKALAFAGLFFGGEEGDGWRERGLALVDAQLVEQILADGAHYERSPMYQATLLEDVLDLIALAEAANGIEVGQLRRWRGTAATMLGWLAAMSHPDGEIAFFNDAAFGIAPTVAALTDYAHRLGIAGTVPGCDASASGSRWLEPSGYARLVAGEATLLADLAPVGPDHQPGHAHADTLSFELSLGEARVIVNSGTSTYRDSPERHRQRGTPAHNTVTVDGTDSSEVWAGFRVARRAYPFDIVCESGGDSPAASAAHDGYRRLAGRVVHRRAFALDAHALRIVDRLEGRRDEAFASVHFHPRLTLHGDGRVCEGEATVARWEAAGGTARIEPSTWHPRFGASEPGRRLVIDFVADEIVFTLRFGAS